MQRTVLILAGGKSQRFESNPLTPNKCLIISKNKPLILHVIDNLSGVADEIIVVARDEQQGEQIRGRIPAKILLIFDSLKGFGPLAGVLSGLEMASFPYSLVIGCDMPFVNEYAVKFLFRIAERGNYDAVVPRWENGMLEPLHAVYKKEQMLTAIKKTIKKGDKRIFTSLSHLKNVNFLPVNKIKEIDSDLRTFRNINTLEELEKYLR